MHIIYITCIFILLCPVSYFLKVCCGLRIHSWHPCDHLLRIIGSCNILSSFGKMGWQEAIHKSNDIGNWLQQLFPHSLFSFICSSSPSYSFASSALFFLFLLCDQTKWVGIPCLAGNPPITFYKVFVCLSTPKWKTIIMSIGNLRIMKMRFIL